MSEKITQKADRSSGEWSDWQSPTPVNRPSGVPATTDEIREILKEMILSVNYEVLAALKTLLKLFEAIDGGTDTFEYDPAVIGARRVIAKFAVEAAGGSDE